MANAAINDKTDLNATGYHLPKNCFYNRIAFKAINFFFLQKSPI